MPRRFCSIIVGEMFLTNTHCTQGRTMCALGLTYVFNLVTNFGHTLYKLHCIA